MFVCFLFVFLFVCLFVCLLTCLFFILIILGHPQKYTLKILQGSNLIWLRYSGPKKCLFVCLFVFFVCWPVCILFKSSWNSHMNIPWKFREDQTWFGWDNQDLKMFICLFVCLIVCWPVFFIIIILGHPEEYSLKTS